MPSPESFEQSKESIVDWQKFSTAVEKFAVIMEKELSGENRALLQRVNLLIEIQHSPTEALAVIEGSKDSIKAMILKGIVENKISQEVVRDLLQPFGENSIIGELYAQYGRSYKLGGTDSATTDCVQILRNSPTFREFTESNPTRYFSEGSDLVLDERLGRVADTVDRADFGRLTQYKPTKDKMYVFGLVKPPLYFRGKPNITHLQIPNGLNPDPKKLSVIHASSEKGSVVLEPDIMGYLNTHSFERVYVIEIDLKNPYAENLYGREPFFDYENYDGRRYERPTVYDVPLVLDNFTLIAPPKQEVQIYHDEKRVLEVIADSRALEYLTVLTAMRESKIGQMQNMQESLAHRTSPILEHGLDVYLPGGFVPAVNISAPEWVSRKTNPIDHSLGMHQITKVVHPLFNKWLEVLPRTKAEELGAPFKEWWDRKQQGQSIPWEELVPYLDSYDITAKRYVNVAVSTVCGYLLIRHLYEDQLMSAYGTYGETFFGIEEQPESIIALAGAYRSNMDVMVTGSQQYRIAELAYQMGLVDEDFNFTEEAKQSEEYKSYVAQLATKVTDSAQRKLFTKTFVVDGYRGLQLQTVAYMCYRKENPRGGIDFQEFKKAYAISQRHLLSSNNKAVKVIHEMYEKKLGHKPSLLMTEDELREEGTALHTKSVKFANEGLWVLSHYKKLAKENWDAIYSKGDKRRANPVIEEALAERSIETNEISKISPGQGSRFYNLIRNLPQNPWYAQYQAHIMAACFVKGLFAEEARSMEDGEWIAKTGAFITEIFGKNIPRLQKALSSWKIADREVFVELAVASSVLGVDEVVRRVEEKSSPMHFLEDMPERAGIRLSAYTRSFHELMGRFETRENDYLERKADLNEKEKAESFALRVFEAAENEALARGLTRDFALVATAMACCECGWGKEGNEWGEPTLYAAANNIFSIKANYEQYSEQEYLSQDSNEDFDGFYIHHTKEYFDPTNPAEYTEHYEAFRKYDSIEESVKDFFDLIEKQYDLTVEIARSSPDYKEPSKERQEQILDALIKEKYATDPQYVAKTVAVGESVVSILRKYRAII